MTTDSVTPPLAHALDSLRAAQAAGQGPQPGKVSCAELARRAGVSAPTAREVEHQILAKIYVGLIAKGVTTDDLISFLSSPHDH